MRLRTTLLTIPALVTALIAAACGLDVYIYLYPVTSVINSPTNSEDQTAAYYEFNTRDNKNYSISEYRGYEIYYRIYNNATTCANDVSAIKSYNEDNPTLAYTYIQSTKKYRRMTRLKVPAVATSANDDPPLIPSATADNRTIKIRPAANGSEYPQIFTDAGVAIGTADDIAYRTIDETDHGLFEFDEINKGDSDVTYTATDDDIEYWYVQAFVFAYGLDSSFNAIYSEACNIGAVTIFEE